jgi:hypothetical protein
MSRVTSSIQQFLLRCVAPVVCSIAIGYLLFEESVFDRHYGAFQFLWTAVVAASFYYLLLLARPRDAALGAVVLLFLTFLTTGSTHAAYILRDIFYWGGIIATVWLYVHYFRGDGSPAFDRPGFLLGGLYAITMIIASEIHLAVLRALSMETTGGTVVSLANTCAFFGVLIGFAVGSGFAINERFLGEKQHG